MSGNVFQRNGVAVEWRNQSVRPLQGAIRHDQATHSVLAQVASNQFNGVARADQQGGALGQISENLLGQPDCGKGHRNRAGADAGVGAHLLGDCKRVLKQPLQSAAERPGAVGGLIGRLDLTEDLRLAQHQRIQPGGNS